MAMPAMRWIHGFRCDVELPVCSHVTYGSYFYTVSVGHVVLLNVVSDYTDITTQIWGRAFLAARKLWCQESPLFCSAGLACEEP